MRYRKRHHRGVDLAVCSTSSERAVNLVVERMLGSQRKQKFEHILAGDVVSKKKPDPEIYNLAKRQLGVSGGQCAVIEDSRNGLLAAKAADMYCFVTKSGYTGSEDFREADAVYDQLGDPPEPIVTLAELRRIATAPRK